LVRLVGGRRGVEAKALDVLLERAVVVVESTAATNDYGWLVLATVIASTELVPLIPTQPLSLVSGLLFGASKGATITLLGTVTAATVAFSLARGPAGKTLSSVALRLEGGEGDDEGSSNAVLRKMGEGVEDMGFVQQTISIVLLRMSPVVPFSISNYMVGLTPVKPLPFVCGTLIGMSPWCLLYATLGKAAGSILFQDGQAFTIEGLEDLRSAVQQQLSQYSEEMSLFGLGTLVMLSVFVFTMVKKKSEENNNNNNTLL